MGRIMLMSMYVAWPVGKGDLWVIMNNIPDSEKKSHILKKALAWAGSCLSEPDLIPEEIALDASARIYYRLKGKFGSIILLIGPDPDENLRWYYLGKLLRSAEVHLPEIFHKEPNSGFFLLEDLGTERLDTLNHPKTDPKKRLTAYLATAKRLAKYHTSLFSTAGDSPLLNPAYEPKLIKKLEWDYFISGVVKLDYFLKSTPELEAEGEKLSQIVAFEDHDRTVIHRDFQSRNIFLTDNGPTVIDWQGARLGPGFYDLASLLWDPYVELPIDVFKEALKAYYNDSDLKISQDEFREKLFHSAMMRLMQATGAYIKLWKIMNKPSYADYIQPAVSRINKLIEVIGIKQFPLIYELTKKVLSLRLTKT
jgi:aminoglycoside/choline kinase family phosphotransferase